MFKTDDASLDQLSFIFSEADIARFKSLFELLQHRNLGTSSQEELVRLIAGLDRIGALKLEGKIYGFHVEDSYAANQGGDSGEGVELYRRQGNVLKEYRVNSDRDWVLKVDQIVPSLQKDCISTIYTGTIPFQGAFLELTAEADPQDPIRRSVLSDIEIAEFEDSGIKVVTLDSLI